MNFYPKINDTESPVASECKFTYFEILLEMTIQHL